jgi:hypothetical protein
LIFYMTACEDASNCSPGRASPPTIALGDTSSSNLSENGRLLCRATLRECSTTIDTMFQYSIQYDPRQIDRTKIKQCLSTATVNAIRNALGCESPRNKSIRRRRDEQDRYVASRNFLELAAEEGASQGRDLQVAPVVSSADESCPYRVSSSVESIDEVGTKTDIYYMIPRRYDLTHVTTGPECDDVGDNNLGIENEPVECGLVRATATVATNQFVEPFATILRASIVRALQETINDGQFVQFFPKGDGCFVNK